MTQTQFLPLGLPSSSDAGRDFSLPFANIFPLQIVQWPENLKLQILESGGAGPLARPATLAEVLLPLPDVNVALDSLSAETKPIRFVSDTLVSHAHAGLGAAVDFSANADGSMVRSYRKRIISFG